MNSERPHFLLTNDDGIDALGINMLHEVLQNHGRVTMIAPDQERSAVSHAFSLHHPLRLIKRRESVYSLSGTPVDCVMFGLRGFLDPEDLPDFVISGINHGANLGDDVLYSGTVAGALEGAMFSKPAVAVSLATEFSDPKELQKLHMETAAGFMDAFIPHFVEKPCPGGTLLNVNVPNLPKDRIEGSRFTTLGKRIYRDRVIQRHDPQGREYYWIGGDPPEHEPAEGTDFDALSHNHVAITPLKWRMCHGEDLRRYSDWPSIRVE
ncbi:MAG: 5'/3'-nucleotidase SurE [Candidatus Omnitrophica bacterium]|nr:5'/3'-nucleotidase SurE [Candidatus Omnitrophota bacterium]